MNNKKCYLVGIKGVGMTSLAVYLKEKGYRVSGSDVSEEFPTDEILHKNKINVIEGFKKENINYSYDFVVATGAHGGLTNIEVETARQINIPTYSHGEFLGKQLSEKYGISIAGCHGKTTTSALTAYLLSKANLSPSYIIGTAYINGFDAGGKYGKGDYFVAEADEYVTCPLTDRKPRFLWHFPKILVITNIEFDHPDVYKDINDIIDAFLNLVKNLVGEKILICCIDNENVKKLLIKIKQLQLPINIITYGYSSLADYRLTSVFSHQGIISSDIERKNIVVGRLNLRVAGRHNLSNALASLLVGDCIGLKWKEMLPIVASFNGTNRRFEKIYEYKNKLLFDDYAHHPSEILATLKAVKEWYGNRKLIVIFQPHTYSRTKLLLNDFSKSFILADKVFLADIFPSAREKYDNSISSRILAIEINKIKKNSVYVGNLKVLLSLLKKEITGDDLIITMGAGDIYLWHKSIIDLIKNNGK
jgi:UDP-N-acetylmuramate--alanine ligase